MVSGLECLLQMSTVETAVIFPTMLEKMIALVSAGRAGIQDHTLAAPRLAQPQSMTQVGCSLEASHQQLEILALALAGLHSLADLP